ncbi:MAG TPA: hypothetical protein VHW71_11295 [Steroidobacteraceae bacterium]|jgi:hypothetical protein|nr:hypothetical protein [Steroidobacteraceae bacterium]
MNELQSIALGLLGMTHPEIEKARLASHEKTVPTPQRRRSGKQPALRALVRALKFGFAALVAGSRVIPLGDNGRVTRELGLYGARLRR